MDNRTPTTGSRFDPIVAEHRILRKFVAPVAYDCVKLVFVRAGSAVLLGQLKNEVVAEGDALLLGANTLCGGEPEGSISVTTLYLDRDYVIDQFFWQHSGLLADRWEAQEFADELYSEPAQILRLGELRTGLLAPWLDELVSISLSVSAPERFYRLQSLLFAVLDVVTPYVKTAGTRPSLTQPRTSLPSVPRHRQFTPVRAEAHHAIELLQNALDERWTLSRLASAVHLSPTQLSRVFVEAYGKTPLAYLTMLRVEQMSRLLRETNLTVEQAARKVGWSSRNHAARLFRQCVGISPGRYRQLRHRTVA